MNELPLATRQDIADLMVATTTAMVASIAVQLEIQNPGKAYAYYVEQAISRIQAVDDSSVPVESLKPNHLQQIS